MELALPHVVVRVCGLGMGPDLVAALGVHPVEVSDARDEWEMHRLAVGRPAILVVVVDPPDARRVVSEIRPDFPGVPVLLVAESAPPFAPTAADGSGWVDMVSRDRPLQEICWLVLEAVCRAARRPGLAEHPLGPHLIEVDGQGIVGAATLTPAVAIGTFLDLRPGQALLSLLEPHERNTVAAAIARAGGGETVFCTSRILDRNGEPHPVALGVRGLGDGRIAILAQPLIFGGPFVGRHVNDRDPTTGLLTIWAMSRKLAAEKPAAVPADAAMMVVTLDDFETTSHRIGHRHLHDVLRGVASAVNRIFSHPALASRLMGHTFLVFLPNAPGDAPVQQAERLLQGVGDIEIPGGETRIPLRASVGVARVTDGDYDLAMRVAAATAGEARAGGGNRVAVAGPARFTGDMARQLTDSMDLGAWEVWLQPVTGQGGGPAEFHEALARFDGIRQPLTPRADFFRAGRARGLLERFDRMMLQRVLEILDAHPDARISVNVTHETFASQTFPGSFLDLIRQVADAGGRMILEISSRSLTAPEEVVRPRLEALAAAGVAVALDDFGSGICRLRSLTQWPVALVKLDQMVTGYVDDDPLQREFVRTVVSLCRARGITTTAEYTRSAEQLARLVDDGVDLFQGEYFGMARPADEVLATPTGA